MRIIIILILLLVFFALGFLAGIFVLLKRQAKRLQAMRDSLKEAVVIPTAPPPPSLEADRIQKVKSDVLEKKILYEEELALVFRMGQEMFSSVTIENITKVIVENATRVTNAEICTLILEDAKTGEYIPFYSKGVKDEFVDKMRFKKGESISGWVMLSQEVMIRYDIENDSWFKEQNKGEYFVYSLISIPLLAKDRVIGVLNLSNKKSKQQFTVEEIAFLKGLTTEASIALENANLYEQIQESYLKTITALAFALDARDSYTRQHSENVTKYAVAIAQELNLRPQEIDYVRRAGLLHDIGKIGIRDGVLLKPGKLNEEEYNDIKNHPAKGEAIVSALPFLKEEAKIIRHHHERYDGKGYPDGIVGEEIELKARILAVADSFDAMVENRVYRKALELPVAFEELRKNSGKQFDSAVADALIRVLGKNPGLLNKQTSAL
jgi:putative nucleotidyltransferase with HDIG domain